MICFQRTTVGRSGMSLSNQMTPGEPMVNDSNAVWAGDRNGDVRNWSVDIHHQLIYEGVEYHRGSESTKAQVISFVGNEKHIIYYGGIRMGIYHVSCGRGMRSDITDTGPIPRQFSYA